MTLALELEAGASRLAVAESTTLRLKIVNVGSAPAAAPQPPYSPDLPVFEVEGPEGAASFTPRERWAARRLRPAPSTFVRYDSRCTHEVELPPGGELVCELELLHALELGPPGRYRVRAALPEAQSPWLELEVAPFAPERVAHAHRDCGHTIEHTLTWVQAGQVQVCRLELAGQLRDAFSRALAPASAAGVRPTPSAGPRGLGARAPRVLWLEGERLRGADVDLEVPGARALVSPPWQDPDAARTVALVALAPEGGWTPLVEVTLDEGGARVGATHRVPWVVARWSWAPWTQRGRWLLGAVEEGERTALVAARWGDEGPEQARCLTSWPLRLLGADALVDEADRVRGAVLGWAEDEERGRALSVASFTLAHDGAFRRDDPRPWPAHPQAQDVDAVLRTDVLGAAHALTRAGDGPWVYARDGGAPRELPELGPARPELLFAPGGERPLALGFDRREGLVGVPIGYSLRDPSSAEFIQPPLVSGA